MNLPRSVGDVLDEHVTLEVECIDRAYLNLYMPKLVHPVGVVGFFKGHRGMQFASGALMDPISKSFVAAIHRYVKDHGVDLVHFVKGERKDDVARRYLAGHDGAEEILFVGRAQEKCSVFRTERRVNPSTGARYPFIVKASAVVNQFYFYGFDDDFGPFFIKFGTYFPYPAKCCFNGHHWAQRQAAKAGIAFETLDNGFFTCDEPAALQAICSSFSGPRRGVRPQVAGPSPPAVDRGGPSGGLRLRHQCPPSRDLLDPGPGPAHGGPVVLRAGDTRQPRRGPPRPGVAHLRPDRAHPRQASHPQPVPHPGHHRRCHPVDPRRLQEHPNQAIFQASTCRPHGNDHQ